MAADTVLSRRGVADGLAVYASLRGPARAKKMRDIIDSSSVGSTLTSLSMEFVFGNVWSREALDRRQRSLITIGILIALRQTNELKNHLRIGLTNGLIVSEIEEAILQATVYAGFPAARMASDALLEILQEGVPTDKIDNLDK
jgi:4-carboxymuconolactone decarboxylase